MTTLSTQNQWYDVAVSSSITTNFGYTVYWNNVIQARWTALSGTTYTVEYRCLIRKTGGSGGTLTSSYNAYSIGGTGANTQSGSGGTYNFPSTGDYVVSTTSGTVSGASTSPTVTVTGGVVMGYYGTTWGSTSMSGSATLPAVYVKPTTPTISGSATSATSTKVIYGTTSFGIPSSGTVYLYGSTSSTPSTVQASASTTGNKTYTKSGLTANTRYYYRSNAVNGQLSSDYSSTITVVTLPAKLNSLTATTVGETSATLSYAQASDGGALTKTLEYRVGSGSWTTAGTPSSIGNLVIGNLTENQTYTVQARLTTSAGSSETISVTFTTGVASRFYGSVSGQAKQVKKLYGSVNGVARKITKIYGSVNGVAKRVF